MLNVFEPDKPAQTVVCVGHVTACHDTLLPNLALEDQGAPSAARGRVALASVPDRPGTPACRSAHGRAPGGAPRPLQDATDDGARSHCPDLSMAPPVSRSQYAPDRLTTGPPSSMAPDSVAARWPTPTIDNDDPALTSGKGEGDGTTPDRSSTSQQEASWPASTGEPAPTRPHCGRSTNWSASRLIGSWRRPARRALGCILDRAIEPRQGHRGAALVGNDHAVGSFAGVGVSGLRQSRVMVGQMSR
jgi:hypothetical protein